MANNFHDTNGWLVVGFDVHEGFQFFPLPLPGVPFLEVNALHPFIVGPDKHTKTFTNGVPSVADKHEPICLWPHFPVMPHIFNLLFPVDVLVGTQSCWLPRLTVHAEGKPMTTTAITGPVSVNLDCFLFTKGPFGAVLQPGTVETTPSFADYAWGIGRAVVDAIFDYILDKLGADEGEDEIPERVIDILWNDMKDRFLPSFDLDGFLGAVGYTDQALIGSILDGLGVTPPGTEGTGLKWTDLVGTPVNIFDPAPGQNTVDAGQVVVNILGNLFPQYKVLHQEGRL